MRRESLGAPGTSLAYFGGGTIADCGPRLGEDDVRNGEWGGVGAGVCWGVEDDFRVQS